MALNVFINSIGITNVSLSGKDGDIETGFSDLYYYFTFDLVKSI